MKVIQINAEYGRGSTGRIALAISRRLTENDIDNIVFYSANHRSAEPNGVMLGSKPMLRAHQLLSRAFGDQGFHSRFATEKLVKQIREYQPDVILMHNLHGYYLHMDVLFGFLKEYGKPVLWTLHDCWAFTGHCAHYMLAGCSKWLSGCGGCPQRSAYPYSLFFDRSAELYNRKKKLFTDVEHLSLITPSKWLSDEVGKSFLSDKKRVVISNGIDLNSFQPTDSDFRKKHGLENKYIILGVAAVWSDAKGLDVFEELSKRLDPSKYAVVLVGVDEAAEAKLPRNVIAVRRTQNTRELVEIYSAADVFVNPTRQDTYPTVNMEALACGTPVITFNTGGAPEIENGGFVIVTGENTVQGVLDALSLAPKKTAESIAECAEGARSFDEQDCFDRYVDLCRTVYKK